MCESNILQHQGLNHLANLQQQQQQWQQQQQQTAADRPKGHTHQG
jgi:hypothetical protein